MNYFAHAMLFLDRPYFVAGASVPDWLSVVDRRVRVRSKQVEAFLSDADGLTAEVAAGVLQHLRDDARFHEGRAFAETMLGLTAQTRDALDGETGMRPAFLGHLLTELLLDASLIAEDGRRLSRYYGVLDQVDAQRVEAAVNRFAPRATNRLAAFIELFRQAQVLYDYGEDGKLMVRLNQVLQRVGLEPLPDSFVAMLPAARGFVSERKQALLDW
ncbi:MAG: hypothetical protein LLG00_16580 [Planctomycetaceae bacterium]|nr:hypothetical protein [Planctomycetaceae bacterium]